MKVNRSDLTKIDGLWAAVPTPWDADYQFDEGMLARNLLRYRKAGILQVYTTDSTGEFFAIEFSEFRKIVKIFAAAAFDLGLTPAVGCTWTHTDGILKRIQFSLEQGVSIVHLGLPFWMPLSNRDLYNFWGTLGREASEANIVHYNTPLSLRVHGTEEYRRILDQTPNLKAVKIVKGAVEDIRGLASALPGLSFLVSERVLVDGIRVGAAGLCSSLVNMNPNFVKEWYELCRGGMWEMAEERQQVVGLFYREVIGHLLQKGYRHAAIDKAMAAIGGFLEESGLTRLPYLPLTPKDLEDFRAKTERRFKRLLFR